MNPLLKQFLICHGTNYSDVMTRFINNEAMYTSFLSRFLSDCSYQTLVSSLVEHDVTSAFHAAHTLKGVSGNLGLTEIYQTVSPIVEALRQNEIKKAEELLPLLQTSYEQTCTAIKRYT